MKEKETLKKDNSTTPTRKTPSGTASGRGALTKRTPRTTKRLSLEKEAERFLSEQKKPPKEISPRGQLAGVILAGLLARSPYPRVDELTTEAYKWADAIIKKDSEQ